jgi:hypothetical protein
MTHLWRTGTVGVKVVFTEYTPFKSKKELFIADSKHKQNVINILSKKKLVVKVCSTIYASDDADVLIVKTTVESAVNNPLVLHGKDTDLLILFLFHFDLDSNDIYVYSNQ